MFTPEWVCETVRAYRIAENAKRYCKQWGHEADYNRHRRTCMRLAQLLRYAADRIIMVRMQSQEIFGRPDALTVRKPEAKTEYLK